MHKIYKLIFFVLCLCFFVANDLSASKGGSVYGGKSSDAADNFLIDARLQFGSDGQTQLIVRADFPPGYKLYADQFHVDAPGKVKIIPVSLPVPRPEKDIHSGENKLVYDESFDVLYLVQGLSNDFLDLKINYQACGQSRCFLPASREFHLGLDRQDRASSARPYTQKLSAGGRAEWLEKIRHNYAVSARQAGYLDTHDFLSFLDLKEKRAASTIQKTWQAGAKWFAVLLIIIGGLALNFTPCVLPLIPVNLAIIGAGTRAGNFKGGFLKGTFFGIGIILAYGMLGVATVKTGAQFGAINASPWFNLVVAVVFLLLALALFDLIIIDFSKFQSRIKLPGRGLFFIPVLGATSAILAGACVAPVVIAVLLLAADLYLKGQNIGLVMPFLLGVGMALPWPFAGAGLSFLPKPGKWMNYIKYIFAVIILLAALYYGALAVRLFYGNYKQSSISPLRSEELWLKFPDGLTVEQGNKPILVYFGASWCKSCKAMEAATFKAESVRAKLNSFVCIKYEVENPQDESVREVLREFSVLGLPTFVIMERENTRGQTDR